MNDIFLFATNDNLLKRIFINTYADGGVGALIETLFSKEDSHKIFDVVETNQGREKPDFGLNPKKYFYKLIDKEKQRILNLGVKE